MAAMDPCTNFVQVQDYDSSKVELTSFFNELKRDLAKLLKGQLYLTATDDCVNVSPADLVTMLQSKNVTGVQKCARDILVESILTVSKKSGICSIITCCAALSFIEDQFHKKQFGISSPEIIEDLEGLSSMSRHVSLSHIKNTIGTYIHDPLVSSMVIQAYCMAGHSGQIFVDKEYASSSCVELTSGYTFPYGLVPEFIAATKTLLWKNTAVKCLIIDGTIEKVSEIHHVLQYFFEEKWAGLIIARGFGEEVLGTLISNYNRGTLNVVPVLVPYDLEGVNALVDIAVTCNTDVVSSLKGELISSIETQEIPSVQKITLSNKLIVSNPSADSSVRRHLLNILDQKSETNIDDKKDLLDKRAKALSSVCAHIKIDSHQKYRGLCFSRIDHGIKLFREMSAYGAIKLEDALSTLKNSSMKNVIQLFIDSGYTHLPAYSLVLGYKVGKELSDSLMSSNVYLLIDD